MASISLSDAEMDGLVMDLCMNFTESLIRSLEVDLMKQL